MYKTVTRKKTQSKPKVKKSNAFIPQFDVGSGVANFDTFRTAIALELHKTKLQDFADKVDKEYAKGMKRCYRFCKVKGFLMDPSTYSAYYDEMRETFPICHLIFATVVSTHKWTASDITPLKMS